jgi:hypothetical protein
MVSSKTEICNLALDLIGGGVVINVDSPTDPTEELLDRWYDQCRRKCLREHPWNFAQKRASLAASSTDPAFGWSKSFPVPNDFVRLLQIFGSENQIISSEQYEFEGGNILSNNDSVLNIKYVYDITDINRFDPMFIDLLVHEIALMAAYKVTESNGNVDRVGKILERRAALARAIDGQERPPTRRQYSRARNSRNYGQSRDSHRILF